MAPNTGASKRPPGVRRPTGMKRPLALASQGELGTHFDESEEEAVNDIIADNNSSDIGKLRALLQHLELEHFEAAIHRAGVLSIAQMASIADNVLMSPTVGLRKVHIRKLQEECRDRLLASRLRSVDGSPDTPEVGHSVKTQEYIHSSTSAKATALSTGHKTEGGAQPLSPPTPPRVAAHNLAAVNTMPQTPLIQAALGDKHNSDKGTVL